MFYPRLVSKPSGHGTYELQGGKSWHSSGGRDHALFIIGRVVRYRADMTAGSLKIPESRIIAGILLQNADKNQWNSELFDKNVLQARNQETARRISRLLRARLELMQPPLWKMVRDGSTTLTTHACLSAAIKHSSLLGDFLDLIVRDEYRIFSPALSKKLWGSYIEDCRSRDPDMPRWSESTVKRLSSSVFQILAQAGFIEGTRTMKLQTVHIAKEVLNYLLAQKEEYVLRCIKVYP